MQAILVWLFQAALRSTEATDLDKCTKLFTGTSDGEATANGEKVASGDIIVESVAGNDVDEEAAYDEDAMEGSTAEAGGPSNA